MDSTNYEDRWQGRKPPSKSGDEPEAADASQLICPLLSAGLTSGVGKKRDLTCLGASCAWWNREKLRCSIV